MFLAFCVNLHLGKATAKLYVETRWVKGDRKKYFGVESSKSRNYSPAESHVYIQLLYYV